MKNKVDNWTLLARKVLARLGVKLGARDVEELAGAVPLRVEAFLYVLKAKIDPAAVKNVVLQRKALIQDDSAAPQPSQAPQAQ